MIFIIVTIGLLVAMIITKIVHNHQDNDIEREYLLEIEHKNAKKEDSIERRIEESIKVQQEIFQVKDINDIKMIEGSKSKRICVGRAKINTLLLEQLKGSLTFEWSYSTNIVGNAIVSKEIGGTRQSTFIEFKMKRLDSEPSMCSGTITCKIIRSGFDEIVIESDIILGFKHND
jgi:hypothetical protein